MLAVIMEMIAGFILGGFFILLFVAVAKLIRDKVKKDDDDDLDPPDKGDHIGDELVPA
jgi:hypothetical protein